MLKLMDTFVDGNWQKSADTDVKIVWQLQISSFILQKLFPGFLRTFHFCLAQMILHKPIGIVFNFFSAKKPLLLQALRGIYLIAFLILKACLRYIMTSTISEENYLKSLSNKIKLDLVFYVNLWLRRYLPWLKFYIKGTNFLYFNRNFQRSLVFFEKMLDFYKYFGLKIFIVSKKVKILNQNTDYRKLVPKCQYFKIIHRKALAWIMHIPLI